MTAQPRETNEKKRPTLTSGGKLGGSVHGERGQILQGSFSAVSKPNFATKYSLEKREAPSKLSVENEHREEKNNNYFNGVSKKKYPYRSGIRKFN